MSSVSRGINMGPPKDPQLWDKLIELTEEQTRAATSLVEIQRGNSTVHKENAQKLDRLVDASIKSEEVQERIAKALDSMDRRAEERTKNAVTFVTSEVAKAGSNIWIKIFVGLMAFIGVVLTA